MCPKKSVRALAPGHVPLGAEWRAVFILALSFSLCGRSALAQDEAVGTTPAAPSTPSSFAPVSPFASAPVSASGYPGTPAAAASGGTSQLASAPSALFAPGGGLLMLGPVSVRPHLYYEVSYGNSLQASPGQHSNTLINQVSPGILLTLDNHWFLDYTPSLRFYSSRLFQDGVDHVVSLSGGTTFHDWSFGLLQAYSSTEQPLIETAGQTQEELFLTSLTANHSLGSKMSLDLTANQNLRYLDQSSTIAPLNDSRTWSTMEWLNYLIEPHLSAGIGVGFTYDNVSSGPDMTSEQYQARVNWRVSDRLSFLLAGGFEDRQFLSSGTPDLLSPIYSASAQYQIFEPTTLSLTASRSVVPSYFQSEITDLTSISAGLHQRLLGKVYFDASGGYSSTDYHSTSTIFGPAVASNYEVTSLNLRLSTTFLKRATASVFFQQTYVSSSSGAVTALFNYTTTQGGLSLGYAF